MDTNATGTITISLEDFFKGVAQENEYLKKHLAIAIEALEKIADPRKRDHREPDKYTEVGCMSHIAEQALEKIAE